MLRLPCNIGLNQVLTILYLYVNVHVCTQCVNLYMHVTYKSIFIVGIVCNFNVSDKKKLIVLCKRDICCKGDDGKHVSCIPAVVNRCVKCCRLVADPAWFLIAISPVTHCLRLF